jgi:hypothetical protein
VGKEDDAAGRRVYGCRAVNDGDGLFAACLAPLSRRGRVGKLAQLV